MGRSLETEAGAGVSVNDWTLNNPNGLTGSGLIVGLGRLPVGAASAVRLGRSEAWARSLRRITLVATGLAALAIPLALQRATMQAPTLRAALETMITLFALAAAWLLRAQFTSSGRVRDLLLFSAALTAGLIEFAAAALPAALNVNTWTHVAATQLWGELFVGATFAAAALVPSTWSVAGREHPVAIAALTALATAVTAALGGLVVHEEVSPWIHRSALPVTGAVGEPLLWIIVVAAAGALTCAAVGFSRRQRSEADGVAGVLAAAVMLMAGASLSHVLRATQTPGQIDPSDWLRAISVTLILTAALTRERQVRQRISNATALAERRRVARDLHDGIAQDLAFIAAHGPRFAEELGDDHPLVVAAKRALAISRSTISDLADQSGVTAHEALEAIAQELGDRFGIAIAVHAQLDNDLDTAAKEHVTRIAREAIANAARHGRARNVVVSLGPTRRGVALRVTDDGCGIRGEKAAAAPEGFGLRSMRERAAALGGELRVRQTRRGGTELEVVLP